MQKYGSAVRVLVTAAVTCLVTFVFYWLNTIVVLGLLTGISFWVAWEQNSRSQRARQASSTAICYLEADVTDLRQQLQNVKSQRQEYYQQTVQLKAKLAEINLLLKQQSTEKQEYIELLEHELDQFQKLPDKPEDQSTEYEFLINSFESEIEQLKQEITCLQNQLLAQTVEGGLASQDELQPTLPEIPSDHEQADDHLNKYYSGERYSLKITHAKDLTDLPSWKILRQVINKILLLQINPKPNGHKLIHKYRDQRRVYRIRSGDYRICYLIHESPVKQVEIILVDSRDEKTFEDTLESRVS